MFNKKIKKNKKSQYFQYIIREQPGSYTVSKYVTEKQFCVQHNRDLCFISNNIHTEVFYMLRNPEMCFHVDL